LLAVVVHCPHFGRPVTATRNSAIDRLVGCSDSELCRSAPRELADQSSSDPREHDRPFPRGCPVFPSLAKQ
jgi:hypothetical protein